MFYAVDNFEPTGNGVLACSTAPVGSRADSHVLPAPAPPLAPSRHQLDPPVRRRATRTLASARGEEHRRRGHRNRVRIGGRLLIGILLDQETDRQEDLAAAAIQGDNQASSTGVARPWPGFHFRTRAGVRVGHAKLSTNRNATRARIAGAWRPIANAEQLF
jgi:hypothetical protein